MAQASRHVVSELTGCYSWLTGCRHQVSPAHNVISGLNMCLPWLPWPATMHWSAQNVIPGLKMSTVITVDWLCEWTSSIPVDLQQCTHLHKMWYRIKKCLPWLPYIDLVNELIPYLLTCNNALIYGCDCCGPLQWSREASCTALYLFT